MIGVLIPERVGIPSMTVASPLMSSSGSLTFCFSTGLPQFRQVFASSGFSYPHT